MRDCLFCQIANRQIPSEVLYEDDVCLVILDRFPSNEGHMLVIPKCHATDLFSISKEDYAHVMGVAHQMAQQVKKIVGAQGVNILQNNGKAAEQSVFHLHVHVIPRYEKDDVTIRWGQQEPTLEELSAFADRFRKGV